MPRPIAFALTMAVLVTPSCEAPRGEDGGAPAASPLAAPAAQDPKAGEPKAGKPGTEVPMAEDPACDTCETPALPQEALPASEEEWRRKLSQERFYILRQRGTERSGSGEYLHHDEDGVYACAGCDQPLYDSRTKYDACGWPSFWKALPGAVATRDDHGSVEAICSRCEGHLGHIFDDGPPPTGKRH